MGIIVDLINAFAKSKTGTKLYKWAASPKGQKFLYNTMPTMETVVSTGLYIASTEHQKNLERREKNVLQWQNVLSGVLGVTLGSFLNKKVFNFGEKIIKHIDPQKVPDAHKIMGAVRVSLPLVTTAVLMRFALPTITAYISGVMEERRAKAKEKAKLDVVA